MREEYVMSKKRDGFSRREFLLTTGLAGGAAAAGPLLSPGVREAHAAFQPGKKRKIVWVSPFAAPWELSLLVGYRDFCEMAGWEFINTGSSEYSAEIRVREVSNAIRLKPDVLTTDLDITQALGPLLIEARDKGIKVMVTEGGDVEWARANGFVSTVEDPAKTGDIHGWEACLQVEKQTGKKDGLIAVGDHNPESPLLRARVDATLAAVKRYNQEKGTNYETEVFSDDGNKGLVKAVAKWTAKWDVDKDRIVCLCGMGAGSGDAMVKVMQRKGVKPGQVAAGCYDANPTELEGLRAGLLNWLTVRNNYGLGFIPAAQAWQWVERGYPPTDHMMGGDVWVSKDVDKLIEREGLWLEWAKKYGYTK